MNALKEVLSPASWSTIPPKARRAILPPPGFTIVELLICVAIMGLLIQLLLPAVQMARESARNVSCTNNLRQIGIAASLHHDSFGHLPSGGWHFDWAGEPEVGGGKEQPGSWVLSLLDFTEQGHLRDLGTGLQGELRGEALKERCKTSVELFNCPSRRPSQAYPLTNESEYYSRDGLLPTMFLYGARTDYAGNVGAKETLPEFHGSAEWQPPQTLKEGNDPTFMWPMEKRFEQKHGYRAVFDGVIYGRSEVSYKNITDGLSNVYLIGEKKIYQDDYYTAANIGDNEHMYAGFNNDVNRNAYHKATPDSVQGYEMHFGSAHPTTWNVVFCDGSVHKVPYETFLEVHRKLASRDDGEVIGQADL